MIYITYNIDTKTPIDNIKTINENGCQGLICKRPSERQVHLDPIAILREQYLNSSSSLQIILDNAQGWIKMEFLAFLEHE